MLVLRGIVLNIMRWIRDGKMRVVATEGGGYRVPYMCT